MTALLNSGIIEKDKRLLVKYSAMASKLQIFNLMTADYSLAAAMQMDKSVFMMLDMIIKYLKLNIPTNYRLILFNFMINLEIFSALLKKYLKLIIRILERYLQTLSRNQKLTVFNFARIQDLLLQPVKSLELEYFSFHS